jgi:hypothetical protein
LGGTFTIIFDWMTAFASRLAPTGFVVFLWEGWWLGWPHREQAHSYNLIFGASVGLMLFLLASSLASQLPHLDICGVAIRKTGGVLGRRRGGNLEAEAVAQ